jgi:hypothetical protein
MSISHITIPVRGRRALTRDETERRTLVRTLAATGGPRLLLFGLVDDHFHAAARTNRPGYLARDLRKVLRNRRPDLELKPSHLEPVGTRSYLRWLVDYILRQPAKHGLFVHPALWTGSCFQDLVGARLLPGYDPRGLLEELPRFRLRQAYEIVGLSPVKLAPVDDEALRRAGAARLVELAAGVYAVGPELKGGGRAREIIEARALAARAGYTAGLPTSEMARYLGLQARTIRHLARRSDNDRGLDALRRRLALEERAKTWVIQSAR